MRAIIPSRIKHYFIAIKQITTLRTNELIDLFLLARRVNTIQNKAKNNNREYTFTWNNLDKNYSQNSKAREVAPI
jgi:hypothetical protein